MVKPRAQQPSPPTPPSATKKRASDPAAAELGRQIGETLRTMFDDVLTEPVPEKFRALLEELEGKSHEEPR
jgi:hypothetical protein